MDHEKFQSLVKGLYQTVSELENMFPGRHFTPDGHMVGSLGECLVADAYRLELLTASNKGFDALSPSGAKVEIKATQSTRVAFRSCPEHAIVIKILQTGHLKNSITAVAHVFGRCFQANLYPATGNIKLHCRSWLP